MANHELQELWRVHLEEKIIADVAEEGVLITDRCEKERKSKSMQEIAQEKLFPRPID